MQTEMYHAGLTVKREGAGESGSAANVVDSGAVEAVLKRVRSETDPTRFVALAYNNSNNLDLTMVGSGANVRDLQGCFNDDNAGYAIVQVEDLYDSKVKTYRYAYVNWMGENIAGVRKAKIGTCKAQVTRFLGHYNVEIFADKHDEITEEAIKEKVLVTSGTQSRVRDDTTGPVYVAPSVKQAKYEAPEYTKKQAINIINESVIKQQIADIRDNSKPLNWMLIGYKDRETLQPHASGNGDINELRESLSPSGVFYGFLRVEDRVDASTTVKFFHISWVGESVPPLFKGRITSHKGAVEEIFEPYHIKLSGVEFGDMSPEKVNEKLQELKGFKK